MSRFAAWCVLGVVLVGCQSPERQAIQPLPPDAPSLTYQELLLRARNQVSAAHEFFYLDRWTEVEQAADALQQTAAALGKLKPENVPARHRDKLATHADELAKAAADLHAAARAKDESKTTAAFQRLHLKVRELRPE